MKKIFSILIWMTLLPVFVSSCGSNGREENSFIIEDYFEVGVLEPDDAVKKTIEDVLGGLVSEYPVSHKDSICINIECNAVWNVLNNERTSSIKVTSIDTSWFYLTIDEGECTEVIINWDKPTEKPILRTIKSILDTGTFSLYCINHDNVSPERLLNAYIDSLVETEINFKMYLTNGKN